MVSFTCNICGALNHVETFATEPPSCACGSNVRLRALMHLLSIELFGHSLMVTDFPKLKAIRGLGMTDKECYANRLATKFDYKNTYYDREPRLDFREPHPQLAGMYDFILSADVIEHIAPPIEQALGEVCRLLKPCGFFGITVYCNPNDQMREHFPDLYEYRIVPLGDSAVLINRRRNGDLEVREDLIFHGGSGATLEMREFGLTGLQAKLLAAGFRDVRFLTDNVPEYGILFDADVSQPLIARKEPYAMDLAARMQLISLLRAAQGQMRLVSASRWLRIGKRLGLGPKLTGPEEE
jgi:SAM-dependent methyltransferase